MKSKLALAFVREFVSLWFLCKILNSYQRSHILYDKFSSTYQFLGIVALFFSVSCLNQYFSLFFLLQSFLIILFILDSEI